MTDSEKLEKLMIYIKNAEKYYANDIGKLAFIYDIELYMEFELEIPMGYYGKENGDDYGKGKAR